jgi:hypothetical protein
MNGVELAFIITHLNYILLIYAIFLVIHADKGKGTQITENPRYALVKLVEHCDC